MRHAGWNAGRSLSLVMIAKAVEHVGVCTWA